MRCCSREQRRSVDRETCGLDIERRCCMIPDNPKGISKLRFWGKNCRINGISELAAFMQQRRFDPGVEPKSPRLGQLLRLWTPSASLPRNQLVRPPTPQVPPATTKSATLSPSERGVVLQTPRHSRALLPMSGEFAPSRVMPLVKAMGAPDAGNPHVRCSFHSSPLLYR